MAARSKSSSRSNGYYLFARSRRVKGIDCLCNYVTPHIVCLAQICEFPPALGAF